MAGLIERNDKDIVGVLSCYDRAIITGTLPGFGHSEGMTSYLRANGIRIFDYTKFAEPLRDQIRKNAERLAGQNGIEIQFLRKGSIRKETVVQGILAKRGNQPGLVCILSVLVDNAFVTIADFDKAQQLADGLDARELHHVLDRAARTYCPVIKSLGVDYHFSLMQVEYSTDIIFRNRTALEPLYEQLVRTAIHSVKPEQVATFLGRRLTTSVSAELGNEFNTRILGTRIRHHMGPASIKMYDKFGRVLRIETTTNDVAFFKHHRTVEHRDGTSEYKLAPLKKSIYSLGDLRRLLLASNRRYLEFISAIDAPTNGTKLLDKISQPERDAHRTYKGFNFFCKEDRSVLLAIVRGENVITGFRHADLSQLLPGASTNQVSRYIKRLRVHGIIKRIGRRYKYYITDLGRRVVLTGLKLRELFVIPQLNALPSPT